MLDSTNNPGQQHKQEAAERPIAGLFVTMPAHEYVDVQEWCEKTVDPYAEVAKRLNRKLNTTAIEVTANGPTNGLTILVYSMPLVRLALTNLGIKLVRFHDVVFAQVEGHWDVLQIDHHSDPVVHQFVQNTPRPSLLEMYQIVKSIKKTYGFNPFEIRMKYSNSKGVRILRSY